MVNEAMQIGGELFHHDSTKKWTALERINHSEPNRKAGFEVP
jgi:hypothetical protein